MTNREGRLNAGVITAEPTSHFPILRQTFSSSDPAVLWMAPHTPPPAINAGFAELTMASTCIEVMSVICPLLSGPISILGMATKEEWNGKEAQAGRHHRQAA